MALTVWTQPSGYNFGVFQERKTVNQPLPVNLPDGIIVSFKVISGSLPQGLRISGSSIIGTPFEVPRPTDYTFVVRASDGVNISDRTFTMTVDGIDNPNWLTPAGPLPVGSNNAYYIIDSSYIDFNLVASDTDTATGQELKFFIASGEGELPPGLIMLPNGRITGWVQPLLEVPKNGDQGFFDTGLYDSVGYDFGYRSTNGYDTYVYDLVTFDFSVETLKPRKLNRNYEFIATITDGDTITKRKFRIFVVGDDFFRADNVIMQAGEGVYTADVTYVRAPIFTTPKYLGLRRANNYQTFKIDIYEGLQLGPVIYELAPANAMISGLIQREVATDNREGSNTIRYIKSSGIPEVGMKINFHLDFENATNTTYEITDVDPIGGDMYRLTVDLPLDVTIPNASPIYIGTPSELPPGMEFDVASGEIFGKVPYQPAVTKTFNFTIKAIRFGQGTEISISRRVFTVDILGEVESAINWVSPTALGNIDVGFPSSLFVQANTTYPTGAVLYTLETGKLPPGLSLNLDGELVGKVNQLRDQNTYKGFWKPVKQYRRKDIVKIGNKKEIVSATRRKNIARLVTSTNHDFKTGDIIKISSNQLSYNFYSGIEIVVDKWKINSLNSITNINSYYQVKFNIPTQNLAPLAPIFTLVKGTSAINTSFITPVVATVKSTSGSGTGAIFRIDKGSNGTFNYNGLVTITLLNPGVGYLPGDTVTSSGSLLNGVDGINDMTFTLFNGTKFIYKINGNSNSKYNGEFFAVSSTTSTITLGFNENPGTFGTGLISVEVGTATYEAQTQMSVRNYFSYNNPAASADMITTVGTAVGDPFYYRSKVDHVSDVTFTSDNWELYKFPEAEETPTTISDYTESNTLIDKTIIDFDDTTFDRTYNFRVLARDQLGYSATSKDFSLVVTVPNNTYYSNITAKPFMKQQQRDLFREFINDNDVFDPTLIYRLGDPNFGIQRSLSCLIYAGIETKQAVEYISAMGLNNKPKRFNLGTVKKAVAKEPGTNNVVYEIVYIELLDPLEKNGKHLPFRLAHQPSNLNVTIDNNNEFYDGPDFSIDSQFWKRPIPFNASIDRTDVIAGDSGTGVKFPSSITIWRKRLRAIETARRERNYLPLWMRSIQEGSFTELDYVMAVPLCYCKPGTADDILLNIKNSGFDFKLLDYTIDRYIIDSVEGYYEDKYLVFRNDRTTIA